MRLKSVRLLRLSLLFLSAGSIAMGQGIITTVAGTDYFFNGDGKPAVEASLGLVRDIAVSPNGDVYISDPSNNMIFRVDLDGVLTVHAGNGLRGFSGDGGPARSARLDDPSGVAIDGTGNVYFADSRNHRVRRVSPDGIITTVVGTGANSSSGDGGLALEAALSLPADVAVDLFGNLYVAEQLGRRVRRVTSGGIISTVAGTDTAPLNIPTSIDLDLAGNLYIVDGPGAIKVSPAGEVTRIFDISAFPLPLPAGFPPGTAGPFGIAVYSPDRIFLALPRANLIVQIGPAGQISAVAGKLVEDFSGDGGPAVEGSLSIPQEVAVDGNGVLYIADSFNKRVRRVSIDGNISTFAGSGEFQFSGDGGPATSAVMRPHSIDVDNQGNIFITEELNHRIRKVSGDGIVSTVAGTGTRGFSGDGGPAVSAKVFRPTLVDLDAAGNIYFHDSFNGRIRRIDTIGTIQTVGEIFGENFPFGVDAGATIAVAGDGTIYLSRPLSFQFNICQIIRISPGGERSVFAGRGPCGSDGDGGLARNAGMTPFLGDVDSLGQVFLSDLENFSGNARIRRISPTGIINTLIRGLAGPLAVDSLGSVFVAGFDVVTRVDPAGSAAIVAGNWQLGFSGDGGPATAASVRAQDVAVDLQGNLYISEEDRVRKVLVTRPTFARPSVETLRFTGKSSGAPTEPQRFTISTSVPGMAFTANAQYRVGDGWLLVSPTQGITPGLLEVTANPSNLQPGEYEGTIRITVPHAAPFRWTVNVRFVVDAPIPPTLSVDASGLSFTYPQGAPARSETFMVSNAGGGVLDFGAAAGTDSGGQWLSVAPSRGAATPAEAVAVTVTANPQGLPVGTYLGRVTIASSTSAESIDLPVTMTVSASQQALLLSQSGLSFAAVAGGGVVPPQSFGVVNLGRGAMNWTASTSTLEGGGWLSASPTSGSSDPASTLPTVEVQIDQRGLMPGGYYGLVRVEASAAPNSPQVVTVFLEVLTPGSDPGPVVTPNELIFSGVSGTISPSSQDAFVYNITASPKTFRSVRSTANGLDWFQTLPNDATLDPQRPLRIVVQPFAEALPAGVHHGNLALQFSDGRVRSVALTFVLTEAAGGNNQPAGLAAVESCAPTKLLPVLPSLGSEFSVSAGWPVGLRVEVKDDCGQPLNEGSVVVEFSNGDPQIAMTPLKAGRWEGTWESNTQKLSNVTVTVEASAPERGLRGTREVSGGLRSIQAAPVVTSEGVVSAAASIAHQPLAPGSLISLYGERLAEGQALPDSLPLPNTLAGTTVLIGGKPMPLLFSGDLQVNAMVPFDLNINTRHQVLVRRGPTYARPVAVDVAAAQPAIFRLSGTQAHIYRFTSAGQQILADAANPVAAGDVIVIYCAGLGAVNPPVPAGEAAPGAEPLARTVNPVRLTIGGVEAATSYTGLAPGFSGLYQINATIPPGVPPGDAVPVQLRVAGQTSEIAAMAVR